MRKQLVLFVGIVIFFSATIVFTIVYGPMQRSYLPLPTVVSFQSAAEIYRALEGSGVRGRIAICFTRYLNAHDTIDSQDTRYIELSMNHGIVRKVFHVAPDAAWQEMQGELANRKFVRRTPEGFIWISDARVYIMPLSKFFGEEEKAIIIIEPRVWKQEELGRIADTLRSGRITSDLLVIIRGSAKDTEMFQRAMAGSAGSPAP